MSTWHTRVRSIRTPRGTRYQGIALDGREERYRSPMRVHEYAAYELARSRVAHHNIWHDGSEDAARISGIHVARWCHEAVPA